MARHAINFYEPVMTKPFISTFVLFQLASCTRQDISLQVVRETSELIHAKIYYGTSFKRLDEENEILIQTGLIDTTDEHPPIDVAIIHVNNKEIVLTRSKEIQSADLNTKEYRGEGYHLILTFSKSLEDNITVYEGKCIISKGNLKSDYKIVGRHDLHL